MKIHEEQNKEHVTISLTRYAMLNSSLEDHIEVATRKIADNDKAHKAEIVRLKFDYDKLDKGYVKVIRKSWRDNTLREEVWARDEAIVRLDSQYDKKLNSAIEYETHKHTKATKELKKMSIWAFLKWRKS